MPSNIRPASPAALDALHCLFDALVHQSARVDPVTLVRHRGFIAAHVLGAVVSLAAFGLLYLAVGAAGSYALIALAWFLTPLLIAAFLARTGKLSAAHFLSAANLIGLVTIASMLTGGIGSFAIVWMILVPLEASLSTSRAMVIWSTLAATLALGFLYVGTALEAFPVPIETGLSHSQRALFSHLAAAVYAGALALNVEALQSRAAEEIAANRELVRLLGVALQSERERGRAVVNPQPQPQERVGDAPSATGPDMIMTTIAQHPAAEPCARDRRQTIAA